MLTVIIGVVALAGGFAGGFLIAKKYLKKRSPAPKKKAGASSTKQSATPRAKRRKRCWKPRKRS